ncbi:hypothetical protein BDQ12DRAFT_267152 [Crucibulum laeve]|uniref:Uncharacterized protein n=1 Tax=Crucibulum laeve TaxID=68775 RepID=A0A5C3M465_9AGAR|nr:hypothetical protein BDQ12DRAFT_267152 [Crucibulum laeve]
MDYDVRVMANEDWGHAWIRRGARLIVLCLLRTWGVSPELFYPFTHPSSSQCRRCLIPTSIIPPLSSLLCCSVVCYSLRLLMPLTHLFVLSYNPVIKPQRVRVCLSRWERRSVCTIFV